MDHTLREALRKHRALRTQLDNMLLGDDGDEVEAELKRFVAKRPCWKPKTRPKLSLEKMIDAGKYDWVNSDITEENFPMPEGFVLGAQIKLFRFNESSIFSQEVKKEMKRDGWRPATIWDLLDYGAKYPEMQMSFQIAALGSVTRVDGDRYCACLTRDGTRRNLSLLLSDSGWMLDTFRFLAVCV